MKFLTTSVMALILMATVAIPSSATAATYTNDYSYKLQVLLDKLYALEIELAALRGNCSYGYNCYPTTYYNNTYNSISNLSRIDVDLNRDHAEVVIRYRNGNEDELLFNADTEDEVIEYLIDETRASRSQVIAVTRFNVNLSNNNSGNNSDIDDIRSIDVDIRSGDAFVTVRYDDGERDMFTIRNETRHADIIDEVASELDLDEDDVEDIIDFNNSGSNNNSDVDQIEVTIDESDNDARARVEYEDGDTDTFSFSTDSENRIIEQLADLLDMDENDVEDVTDFEYIN